MRFLLINYEYPPIGAGAATATQAIANQLVELGHKVTVLTARYRDLPAMRVENGVTVRRVRCLRARADRCSVPEMASFVVSALLSLSFVILEDRPEAAIAFFTIPCGPIALVAKTFFGLPYVVSLRGGDVPGLVPEIERTHRILQPVRRASLKCALAIVANANGLRELSEKHDPFPVRVIPNGVDANFFFPAEQPTAAADSFRIVFTGRCQAQKNIPLLLEECAALRAMSQARFELHLIGDGPLRAELVKQAERLGLADCIIWHGWSGREELRAIYQRSHCFVNPSFYEGMPNAVLEAMACGMPVVASDIPGNDAVVRHAETGLLFTLGKPGALREALLSLLQDRGTALLMGQRGRAQAEQNFSWATVAAHYAALFEKA